MSDYVWETVLPKKAYNDVRKVCNRDGMSRVAKDA